MMEMNNIDTKVKAQEEKSHVKGSKKGHSANSKAEATDIDFKKVLEQFAGKQAQTVLGKCSGLEALPNVSTAPQVEKKIEEQPQEQETEVKAEDTQDEQQVEETEGQEDQEQVTDNKAVQNKNEVKNEVVVAQQNVQEEIVVAQVAVQKVATEKQVVVEQKKTEQVVADDNMNMQQQTAQKTAQVQNQRQKTGFSQGSQQQDQSIMQEQVAKPVVSDAERARANAAKVAEASAKDERPAEQASAATAGKLEALADFKAVVADKAKVGAAAEGFTARNAQVVQAVVAADAASGKSGNSAGDATAKQANSAVSGVNAAEKSNAKKATTAAGQANDLPKQQQDKVIEKLQQMVESATKTRNANTMVVRLDPPQLGQMTVKISQRGDQLFARIIPESSDVEAALRSRSSEIVGILSNAGFKADNVHLSFGGDKVMHASSLFGQMLNNESGNSGNANGQNGGNAGGWSQGNDARGQSSSEFNGLGAKVKQSARVQSAGWIA